MKLADKRPPLRLARHVVAMPVFFPLEGSRS